MREESTRGGRWSVERWVVAVLAVGALATGAVRPASAAQCPTAACDPARLATRTLTAVRIDGTPPVVDGRLDDPAWRTAPVATEFVESSPAPAAPASLRSEARVLADDEALYVAFTYFDPEPETIVAPYLRRDDETTSDWAFVEIDSRHDRRTGFSFGVNPRGVQVDGAWLSDTEYDGSWNGVWQGAARLTPDGWTAELRIPFSQLPFRLPDGGGDLTWGINFYRHSSAHGETSNWSPRFSGLSGVVSNWNRLEVPAPPSVRRLELTPYVAPRIGDDGEGGDGSSVTAGADLVAGVGESFRLAATLLPDFGQVEADPSQVNLTSFELFQPERRPFFLEGLDLFRLDTSLAYSTRETSFADESPFYSRRVGRRPQGEIPAGATALAVPDATTVLGAAKLTGQLPGGVSVGLFSAATDRERARVRRADGTVSDVAVAAPSLVTVARAVGSSDDGDGTWGLFAANLHRTGLADGLAEQQLEDALVLGGELRRRFAERRYETRSFLLASRVSGDEAAVARVAEAPQHDFQRPGARGLPEAPYGDHLDGLAAETRLSRVGGALTWDLVGRAVSPSFDVDEIGFERNSDWLLLAGAWRLRRFRPGHRIRAWSVGSDNLGRGWTWSGEPRVTTFDTWASFDTRNYWHGRIWLTRELTTLSTERLRGGPALLLPPRSGMTVSVATDQRRPTSASLTAGGSSEPASGSWRTSWSALWNVRTSDRFQGSIGPSYSVDVVGWQPVGRAGSEADPVYVVGRVRQETLAVELRGELVLSPRLSIEGYLRPFASVGRFDRFSRLLAPRDPDPARRFSTLPADGQSVDAESGELALDLDGDGILESRLSAPGGEERSLDGSVVLRWELRPGSFLTAVWNHHSDVAGLGDPRGPEDALGDLAGDPSRDILLLKLSFRLAPSGGPAESPADA